MLEPSDSAEALAFVRLAYELSEEYDTAVLLKMCTRVSHSQSVVETGNKPVNGGCKAPYFLLRHGPDHAQL